MPQFSVDSRTIDNVIGYINNGQISIPEIQRPFVWDGSKIRDLIDSLYNGFPVGYLIVWQNLAETFWEVTFPQQLETSSSVSPAFTIYLAAQCKLNDDSFLCLTTEPD